MATDFSQYAVPDSAPAQTGGTDFSQYLAQPTPAPAAPVSGAMATTRGLINGATVGFGPKASAAGRAIIVNPVEDALHAIGVGPGSTGQTYSQMRDEEMAANSEAAKQHPIAYLAGDVAGGLPLGAVAKTGLAANAAIGAVRGGNSGAPGDTLTNMAEGGALGTAGAYLGRGVANLGKNAADKLVDAVSNAYKITREEAKAALVSHFGGTGVPATTTLAPVAGQVANVPSAAVSALASKVNIPAAVAGFVGGTNTAHPILGTAAGLVPYAGTVLKIA